MVWPILISVAVTPRISAASEGAGQVSAATALRMRSLVTKRIDSPPRLFVPRARWRPWRTRFGPRSAVGKTWHDVTTEAHRNCRTSQESPSLTTRNPLAIPFFPIDGEQQAHQLKRVLNANFGLGTVRDWG